MKLTGWLWVLAGVSLVSAGVTWLCLTAQFVYHHPDAPDVRFEVRKNRVVMVKAREKTERETSADDKGVDVAGPRVRVRQARYDFGEMTPHSDGVRVFVVDNVGAEPLTLRQGETTCKCTFSELHDNVVAPGESGKVMLGWNTGAAVGRYVQSAIIETNDPESPQVELSVSGEVKYQYAVRDKELVFEGVSPDQAMSDYTYLVSQDWDDLVITDISCNLEGVSWDLIPATEDELERMQVQAGYRLVVHIPEDFSPGPFGGIIHTVAASAENPEATASIDVVVRGDVLRRFCLYADIISEDGLFDLGRLKPGKEHKWRMLVRIRDEVKELKNVKIEVVPKSLEVSLDPYRPDKGLYYLNLRMGPDAPECRHLGLNELGFVKLNFDHPRIESQEFPVRVGVARVAR